ncbi:MAG: Rrf2 family transcriptional regulator [Thermodesulfobacteriota bacterium]|nr:Rrf2 family transcriptional regulator [Thermodesulfobacteriota bacterium]
MRLTRAAEYAIRCMVYLSTRGRGVLTSRQEIAARADIPTHFLAKIAQDLARANFIEIRQGAQGGFMLAKNPAQITLLEVVETMIGEIYLNDCVARPSSCTISYDCTVHRVWMTAREQLRATLNKVTFDQLIKEKSCVPSIPAREIGTNPLDGILPDSQDKLQ